MATLNQVMTQLRDPADGNYSAEVVGMNQDYQAIANWFNFRALINNPTPQGTVIDPVDDITELINLLASAEEEAAFRAGIDAIAMQQKLSGIIQFKTSPTIESLCDAMMGVSNASKALIKARCQRTVPDPNWPPQVPGPSRAELFQVPSPVLPEHIQNFFNP